MAGLAGGDDIFAIEGQRGLFGEAGSLPLVIDGEGAEPLVVVHGAGDGGFVAGGAELGCFIDGAHDGLGVAVEVREDFGVGDWPGDGLAAGVNEDCGDAHNVAAGAGGIDRLDGMAGGAGDAFILKGTLFGHALGEIAGEQRDGIVAALAVARILDALLVDEHVDVLQIPGISEGVGVNGLAPLGVSLLVAVATVLCGVEALGAEELAVGGGGVGGQERSVFAEGVVVSGGDGVVKLCGGAGDRDVGAVVGERLV